MPETLADMRLSMFGRCAELCAQHQWEVIVTIVTFTICMLTLNERQLPTPWFQTGCQIPKEYFGADAVIMTAVRCIALLYTYQQFRKLHSLGSKYILGLACVFMVISTAVFTSSIINFMHSGLSDLKDALFFFLLLVDMSKVSRLAQYALSASHVSQVSTNISAGMAVLGPQITLDVLVEVLLISVGTLSGVYRLEMLCCYACMSALVSYLMFMTFYPACLSLVLEMSSDDSERQPWQVSSFSSLLLEDANKPNIVVQRVKVIMSVGLTFVHFISRWPSPSSDVASAGLDQFPAESSCEAQAPSPYHVLLRWMSVSAEHLVILIIVVALVVKYVLFEQSESTPAVPDKPEVWGSSGRTGRRRCPSVVISESADGGVKVTPVDDSDDEDGKVKSATDAMNAGSQTTRHPGVKALRRSRVAAALRRDSIDSDSTQEDSDATEASEEPPRPLDECQRLLQEEGAESVTDAEVLLLLRHRRLRTYQLESRLEDLERAVSVRRQHLLEAAQMHQACMDDLPYTGYEYDRVLNTCCENVVGYMPLPIGVVGPLHLNGDKIYVPLATTEGALVASTNRGCLAIRQCGVNSYIVGDGMTRAPVIECPSAKMASEILFWLELSDNFRIMKEHFDSTSRFARLKDIQISMFGRQLFLRFVAQTGDAMGMNMVSKGTEKALERLKETFPDIIVTSVSSNVCTDKKPSAVNWIKGRGKSVICEAVIPAEVVRTVLKTSAAAMVNLCIKKNLIGSAVAGSIGGNNAHAANIVTAIYIATGQDPAQNVGSSSCMTLLEPWGVDGQDLYVTCTMPCVEVGTVGGGTVLSAQRACLKMLGCQGANYTDPGKNARRLASIVGATVLAGEVSLLAAQSAGHLVKSHMVLNRSSAATVTGSQTVASAQNTSAGSSQHTR